MFFTLRSMILHGVRFFNTKIPISLRKRNKKQTILTPWSVAQAGSNDEKTGGRKSRWTVPLRRG